MYINVDNYTDENGNLKEVFTIESYLKVRGKWVKEEETFESGRKYFLVGEGDLEDKELYMVHDSRTGKALRLNTDFNDTGYGRCFKVVDLRQGEKRIVGNEVVFTEELGRFDIKLSLHKQSYNDGTCFYTLKDKNGRSRVEHGSKDINKLIKQITREITSTKKAKEKVKHLEDVNGVNHMEMNYQRSIKWLQDILEGLKKEQQLVA